MKVDVNLELFLDENAQILSKHIELLKAIKQTKSITKAAQMVGISYKNAWDSLDIINNKSYKPLIIRADGNKKNSGSQLSEYGEKMIEIYDAILEAQKDYLAKLCAKVDFEDIDIINLQRMGLNLSARNQLTCEITKINTGAVNTEVIAKLSSGESLSALITCQSEQNLGLKVSKRVVFIFKAPAVMLLSPKSELSLSVKNKIKGRVIEAKIGAVNAEITLDIGSEQTITAIITKESAIKLEVGVGDEFYAIIKSSDIIIGA